MWNQSSVFFVAFANTGFSKRDSRDLHKDSSNGMIYGGLGIPRDSNKGMIGRLRDPYCRDPNMKQMQVTQHFQLLCNSSWCISC